MVQYKKFKVGELFDIHPTKSYKMTNRKLMNNDGKVAVLTNTSINNGVGGWSDLDPTETNSLPMITFSDTTTGPDTLFVQTKPYIGYSHVQGMYSKIDHHWTDLELLYVVVAIKAGAGTGWSYATKFNRKQVSNLGILLPVTSSGQPDFEYMTARIRELEAEKIRELEAYLHVTGLDDTTLSASEAQALTQKVQWKKFKVGDVFDKKTVKGYPKKIEDLTSVSDGYHTFGQNIHYQHCQRIKMPDKYLFKVTRPILAYASSTGSVGMINESFYRSGDNGAFQALLPKFDDKRVTTMLFILVVMKRIFAQFNYNTNVRGILDMDILLPVTSDDQIDFDYMQNYIRATEKQTIKGVVEYKDRVIAETKKVVND